MTKHSARSSRSRAYEGWLWCNGSICFDFGSAFNSPSFKVQIHDMSLRKTYLDSNRLQLASYSLLPKPPACPGDDSSSDSDLQDFMVENFSKGVTRLNLLWEILPRWEGLYNSTIVQYQSSSKPWIEFLTLFLFLCGVCGGFCQRRLERGSQDPQTSEAAWCLDRKLIGIASTYTSVTQTLYNANSEWTWFDGILFECLDWFFILLNRSLTFNCLC